MKDRYKKRLPRMAERRREKLRIRLIFLSSILLVVAGICLYDFTSGPATSPSKRNRIAVVETSMGTMEFELYEDKAPLTTSNFIELAEDGSYDGLIFHRVVKGFVVPGW
ncbi:MAG: peptidylprolyl isomerase [Candidatus Bathyarchaeia archaeon]